MKLEFLDDISDGGKYPYADPDKLIRLYAFDHIEADTLITIIQDSIIRKGESVDISHLPFVQPVNCSLLFEIAETDLGVDFSGESRFICKLSLEGYKLMIGYMSAFRHKDDKMDGYNWLYDPAVDKVDLLFSPGGTW